MARGDDIRGVAVRLFATRGFHGTSMKDIAEAMGMRAPSLYNYVDSKQELLRAVIIEELTELQETFDAAVASTEDVSTQLFRATEAHVLHHATYPNEVHIGNRELASLEEPARAEVLDRRRRYAHAWRGIIERGNQEGAFAAKSPKIASYAILEMGIGVANWFDPEGELSAAEIAWNFGEIALNLVGAGRSGSNAVAGSPGSGKAAAVGANPLSPLGDL